VKQSFPICLILLLSTYVLACTTDETVDLEKPTIDLTLPEVFPLDGDTLSFEDSLYVKLRLQDNVALGSKRCLNLSIHHNFDHHSHSTEVDESNLDPVKTPVNPLTFIQSYDLPAGLSTYDTNILLILPPSNDQGLYDEGDYHFFISLTDAQGWSTQKGLSIKLLHR